MNNTTVSNDWKYNVMSCPNIHPSKTRDGVRKSAIC